MNDALFTKSSKVTRLRYKCTYGYICNCSHCTLAVSSDCTYGMKSVDRSVTQSMSKICNLRHLIVVDCDYTESYRWFLSGGNADASHSVYIVPDDS